MGLENQSPWAITGWVVAFFGLLGIVLRQIGPWRKQLSDAEQNIRKELHDQIEALKADMLNERIVHATEMRAFNNERDEMGDRLHILEKQMTRQQLRHNAERALDRHRLNNMTACFDAMLMMLEMNPERAPEVVAKIKEMRAAQMLAEAEEKAIIRAAEIKADDLEADHDGN